METVVYNIKDVGLANVDIVRSGATGFDISGTRSRITSGGTRDTALSYPMVSIADTDVLRLEFYSEGTLIDTFEGIAKSYLSDADGSLQLDIYEIIVNELSLTSGTFEVQGFIIDKISDLSVIDISRNKTEIKINNSLVDLRELGTDPIPLYIFHVPTQKSYPIVNWVNDKYTEEKYLIVKHTPHDNVLTFPRDIRPKDEIEIWDQVLNPFNFSVRISLPVVEVSEDYNALRGPDFYIDLNRRVGKATGVLTEELILNAVPDVRNRIINKMFSGSIDTNGAELNIDYRDYSNFIHFSSAKQRLTNFYSKMKSIELYTSQSQAISIDLVGLSGAGATSSYEYIHNKSVFDRKVDEVIGNFDSYENYLYYDSASIESDTYGNYSQTTWPKETSIKPYTNASISSSAVTNWYPDAIEVASLYDGKNQNILRDLLPFHVRLDSQNNGFILFVDMVAQHFDVLYNYIDHLGSINKRDENVDIGISKDLLYSVLKSMGWEAVSGWDKEELWSYFLGYNSSGSYQSTSSIEYPTGATLNYAATESLSYRDLELEPYSRLFNNLPYIYKTKGTERSIKAFLTCYGIPTSILRIQEFGGPDPINSISGSQLRYIEIANNELITSASYITAPWNNIEFSGDGSFLFTTNLYLPRTIEFRFRTNTKSTQGIIGKEEDWGIWMEHSSSNATSNYGRMHFSLSGSDGYVSASTTYSPIYDNDYWSVFLRQENKIKVSGTVIDGPNVVWKLDVKKAPNHASGRITHAISASIESDDLLASVSQSYIDAWGNGSIEGIHLGEVHSSGSVFANITNYTTSLNGAIQEFKIWRTELPNHVLDGHTQAPTSYYGATYSESYDNLVFRIPIGTDNNLVPISQSGLILTSSHPSQIMQYAGSPTYLSKAYGYTTSSWNTVDDTYYVHVPNSIGLRPQSSKIRIEDNSNDNVLDPFNSYESSSFDNYPLDSNMISVAFSPQDNIDLDIAYQFGGIILDDIVGDPRDRFESEYNSLRILRDTYFKKFNKENNVFAFLRLIGLFNSAIFKQIEQLLPARAHKIVGVLIKPSVLERPKIVTEASLSLEVPTYSASIDLYSDSTFITADDSDSMTYIDRFGGSSIFSTLTDTIPTWEIGDYDRRFGSRYTYDESTALYGTSSVIFEFTAPSVAPIGSLFFVGSNVQFLYTSSADFGTDTSNLIHVDNTTGTAGAMVNALRDAINTNSELIEIPLSASSLGGGNIKVSFTTLNSARANTIIVHSGSAPNDELTSLSIASGFVAGSGSFFGPVQFKLNIRTIDGIQPFISESIQSEFLYKKNYFYSSSHSRSRDDSFSSSLELSRIHPYNPNSFYIGSKVTSADFNIDSFDTIDGGPVVEWNTLTSGSVAIGIIPPPSPL